MQVMVVAHSLGDFVARAFMAWADARQPGWCNEHVGVYANTLGTPRALSPLLSGGLCSASSYLPAAGVCHTLQWLVKLLGLSQAAPGSHYG